MSTTREDGYCCATMKDGSVYRFKLGQYNALLAAWKGGVAFFDGIGVNEQPASIKLGGVEHVARWTPESLRACIHDVEEEEVDDKARRMGLGLD